MKKSHESKEIIMYDIITDIWRNPGAAYSPMPFWFWNDTLDKDKLVRQMDDFHRKGVDGFVIHPRMGMAGVEYLSDEYFELVRFVCEEAKKRFMLVILYDEGMYPSGSAHGKVVAEDARLAARRLYCQPMTEAIPEGDELCYRLYLKLEDGKLISTSLGPADGHEAYNFILGYTNGTIRGLKEDEDDGRPNAPKAADLLNPAATDAFMRATHEKYYETLKDFFGQTVIGIFTDEPSLTGRCVTMDNGISWSYATIEYFMNEGGEIEQLASLFFETKDKKLKREAEYIYHNALRKNLCDAFYAPMSAWCREKGIALMGHPAESDNCDTMKYFHIPGQDLVWRIVEPGTELTSKDSVMAKLASDCARHQGVSRSSNECFGACGDALNPWNFTPDDMMWTLNFLFARGCSMIIPHAFYYSLRTPLQSNERPPDVGPNAIWWKDYRKISGYIKRMSWLGATGTNNPQAAVLCSSEYVPITSVKPLYEQGYTFNYLTLEDLMTKAHVHDGEIHIDRYEYDIVLIDGRLRLNTDIVKKIGQFVTEGGKMFRGTDFAGFMNKNVKKTSYFEGETHKNLRFTHYTKSGCEFFLFVNEGKEEIVGRFITDISCAAADFDPFTGKTSEMNAEMIDGGFAYAITIPAHSVKVIGMNPKALPNLGKIKKYTLMEIVSLSQGRMTFEYTPAENRMVKLSFTAIHDLAEVTVNGENAGRLMFMPYECDITQYLHDGKNEVAVEVIGSPANIYGKPVAVGFEGCTVRIYDIAD